MLIGLGQKKEKRSENSLQNALVSRKGDVVHLTHNDLDAIGADAIHRMKYGEIFTIFSSVGNFPGLFATVASVPGKGHILSISDLGYQEGIERQARKATSNGWNIQWRDHHRWQDEEKARIEDEIDLLHIDTKKCACGIVAADLEPENSIAQEVAKVVCDYDLWVMQDLRGAVLGRVASREENRIHVRDCLVQGIFTDAHIEQQYQEIEQEIRDATQQSIEHSHLYKNKYQIAFTPLYGYPSETAYALRDALGSEIEVIVSSSGKFSIRSVPPISHLIARQFRGGGHPHAAGGNFNFTLLDRLAFWLFKRTRHFNRLVEAAESI
jgi:uncharacterized protein